MNPDQSRLYSTAYRLAILTIVYNLAEGFASLYFGEKDGSLVLCGFGLDSFIEVISGIGIAHMVLRIRRNPESGKDRFEKTALMITGVAFYLLVVGLVLTGALKLFSGEKPETTIPGIVLSVISISAMLVLIRAKLAVGRSLDSAPIIADARCTQVCVTMSIVLLASSVLYEFTRIGYVDVLGSFGLAWLSFREGREAIGKARRSGECSCGDD